MQLHSEARGMTPWARLQNYNVKFDYSVNVVVQMDVHRETGDLLPNELKLVVMQVSTRPSSLGGVIVARDTVGNGILSAHTARAVDNNTVV